MRKGILIPNTAGLVNTTAAAVGDLVHTLSTGRTAKIAKIMWSNNSGFNGTLIFGTRDNAVPAAAHVPLLPTITCLNGFDGEFRQEEIPDVIFALDRTATPNGRDGNIYVVSSVAGILVRIAVEERG